MKKVSHKIISQLAFELLNEIYLETKQQSWDWFVFKDLVADAAFSADDKEDVEFVHVKGIRGHGRDNPHRDDGYDTIDDTAHFGVKCSGKWRYFTAFNHFIDIRKGPGSFDDYDGYSYHHGSGKKDQNESAGSASQDEDCWYVELAADLSYMMADEAIMWWYNDEYVHAPGHRWYRGCSPAVERYSYFQEQGKYRSLREEAQARFPRAQKTGSSSKGIPYSIFLPVDNMARYWFNRFRNDNDESLLGYVLHAIQDASIPHHAAGCLGNWHGTYEKSIKQRIEEWISDDSFKQAVIELFRQYNRITSDPPLQLNRSDFSKIPARNWRVDMLVTWLALNAYYAFYDTWKNFEVTGFEWERDLKVKLLCEEPTNVNSMRDLTQKAVAVSMLVLAEASQFHVEPGDVSCFPFNYDELQVTIELPPIELPTPHTSHTQVTPSWKITIDTGSQSPVYSKLNIVTTHNRADADRALEIIKHYKMNKCCVVGDLQNPLLKFYLSNDIAPGKDIVRSLIEDVEIFNPSNLEIKRQLDTYKIVESGTTDKILLDLGNNEIKARQTLAVIQKYGFSRLGYVGERSRPAMMYFRVATQQEWIDGIEESPFPTPINRHPPSSPIPPG